MIADAHWRRGAGDREAIAPPGVCVSIAKNLTTTQQFWGKVTSRKPAANTKAALELAAFRLGVKPATLSKAIEMGVFDG